MERYSHNLRLFLRDSRRRTCLFCQFRQFQSTARNHVKRAESKFVKRSEEFQHSRYLQGELVPKPLSRPLGLSYAPEPGQNSGIDDRSFKQRWDDYYNYEKHLQRRQDIIDEVLKKNYWRDVGNLGKIHKGKSMIAPKTPYRADVALYFPNLQGTTLASPSTATDTTHALRDHITVVNLMSTRWAEEQCNTFTSLKSNPELHEYLKETATADAASAASNEKQPPKLQQAFINVETNWLKSTIVKMLFGRLRREYPKNQHSRYFLVTKGLSDEIRDALGMWNSKVGYVYLLDTQLKVRWAGNGNATAEERQSLVNCLKRLRKGDDPTKRALDPKSSAAQVEMRRSVFPLKQQGKEKETKSPKPKQGKVAVGSAS